MNDIYVVLRFDREGNDRLIREVEFILNKTEIIHYTSLLPIYFHIDYENRRIRTDLKHFSYARLDNKVVMKAGLKDEENWYGFIVGKGIFMELMMMCHLEMNYESHLSEKDKRDIFVEVIKRLY